MKTQSEHGATSRHLVSAASLLLLLSASSAALLGAAAPGLAQPREAERPNAGPPDPNDPRLLRHRRMVEEGQRASRATPPPPRPPEGLRRENGIIQLPLASGRAAEPSKDDSRPAPPDASALRARAQRRPVPPPPPFQPPPPGCPNRPKSAALLKNFAEVSWQVCVRDVGLKALWVGPVYMQRTPTSPWMMVIYDAGLAEIFVPYHQVNFRPYDLQWTTGLNFVTQQDAGPFGSLVWLSGETGPTVVAEVRERGIGWLCKGGTIGTPVNMVRRGQDFVVWAVSDAGNYDNIIEYGFRDDGTMTFRMGNTGLNSPADPVEPHTHNALWRVDMDLNGWPGDTATWLAHGEPSPPVVLPFARDDRTALGVEGGKKWDDLEFSSLLIEDNAANGFGHKLGYVYSPLQDGLARHFGYKELWTQSDIYVTRWKASELGWMNNWQYPDDYLLTYLNQESVNGQDLVVWLKTSGHHHPTDEDRATADLGPNTHTGITLTHWSGFKIEPYNLFNANPLGGLVQC